jgi:1-acyl-sn-glycerol-3-phosphate acyltransferase
VILLRSTLFNITFYIVTFLLTIVGTLVRWIYPDRVMGIARLWAWTNVAALRVLCGIRLRVSGCEHLPAGAALIASAHQSAFDTMVWLTLVPRCCYVLKRELVRIPLFGQLIVASRMIAVDREGGASSMRHLLREADRAVREARQIVIFPEGTRSAPGTMLPLQPGIAALAARTGLPVIPVVTDSGHCWGRRAFRKRAGVISISIGPPLASGLGRDDLMQRLRQALSQAPQGWEKPGDNSVDRALTGL